MAKEFVSAECLGDGENQAVHITPDLGDLIRLDDGSVVAIVTQCDDDGLLVVWPDCSSALLSEDWVNPVEILGKCVFGMYK